jgi:hypothetical protein
VWRAGGRLRFLKADFHRKRTLPFDAQRDLAQGDEPRRLK